MGRALGSLSPLEKDVAEEFARRVRRRFGTQALELKVFGSRARGEAREDSDLDVWVLLERAGWEERAAVCDMATDLLLQRDLPFVISARVMSREQHERLVSLERLLPREIERDGIPL